MSEGFVAYSTIVSLDFAKPCTCYGRQHTTAELMKEKGRAREARRRGSCGSAMPSTLSEARSCVVSWGAIMGITATRMAPFVKEMLSGARRRKSDQRASCIGFVTESRLSKSLKRRAEWTDTSMQDIAETKQPTWIAQEQLCAVFVAH